MVVLMRDDQFSIRRRLVAFQDLPHYGFGGVKLAYFECHDGKYFQSEPLTLKEVPDAMGRSIEAFTTLGTEMAQDLFNDLWQMGFRPKDGTGNSSHIESLKYHLEDMRKLVFTKSEVEK
jgi:hypothetical protein